VSLSRLVVGHEVNVTSCVTARLIGAGYELRSVETLALRAVRDGRGGVSGTD
jgi:hypothetical protein